MQVDFAPSARSSIGLEWELALVDADTLELVPAATAVLDAVGWDDQAPIRKEYLQCMIELVSAPHLRVADAVTDLADKLARVREITDPLGVRLLGSGTHPFSLAHQQQPFRGPRYDIVKERTAYWGRQMAICGTHIHVGVADRDQALPITNGLARFYPFFLALSASSPFWEGQDTGLASQRTMIFQQLPTNGLPYRMTAWWEFEAYATELAEVGMISVPGEIRWDVRPSPKFGTVENRTADSVPTLGELGCLAAMSQCLAEFIARDFDGEQVVEDLPPWLVKENKWRAARYGMDADIITPDRPDRVRPLRKYIAEWIDRLLPVAVDLDCEADLLFADELCSGGTSYERQRAVADATDGDLRAVTSRLLDETGAASPFGQPVVATEPEEATQPRHAGLDPASPPPPHPSRDPGSSPG